MELELQNGLAVHEADSDTAEPEPEPAWIAQYAEWLDPCLAEGGIDILREWYEHDHESEYESESDASEYETYPPLSHSARWSRRPCYLLTIWEEWEDLELAVQDDDDEWFEIEVDEVEAELGFHWTTKPAHPTHLKPVSAGLA